MEGHCCDLPGLLREVRAILNLEARLDEMKASHNRIEQTQATIIEKLGELGQKILDADAVQKTIDDQTALLIADRKALDAATKP